MSSTSSSSQNTTTNAPKKRVVTKGKKIVIKKPYHECRLLEFNALDDVDVNFDDDYSDDEMSVYSNDSSNDAKPTFSPRNFKVQMFGIDEKGKTYSITAENYYPYFYVKVGDHWNNKKKQEFVLFIKRSLGEHKAREVKDIEIVKAKKLYGFDNEKDHKFLVLRFTTLACFYKTKKLWYKKVGEENKLLKGGLSFASEKLELYEGHIPPLLRMFHIRDISPSGWVRIYKKDFIELAGAAKKTTCHYEFCIDYEKIESLREKEAMVPYKICSFDIEASSSHGDFPLPIKTYKKLCDQIIEFFDSSFVASQLLPLINSQETLRSIITKDALHYLIGCALVKALVHNANVEGKFVDNSTALINRIGEMVPECHKQLKTCIMKYVDLFVDKIYLKDKYDNCKGCERALVNQFQAFIQQKDIDGTNNDDALNDETLFQYFNAEGNGEEEGGNFATGQVDVCDDVYDDDDDEGDKYSSVTTKNKISKSKAVDKVLFVEKLISNLVYNAKNNSIQVEDKNDIIMLLNKQLTRLFPKVEGDKVTFIGSTFRKNGEENPYLNHCLVLGSSDNLDNAEIETCEDEAKLLLAWTKVIQREDPDIIIGYNIFGFDYLFMYNRARENEIEKEFLKLSRNKNELCGKVDYNTGNVSLNQLSIRIASGEHNLYYPQMNGRLQIDMLNYFRREFTLEMYKLDFISGYFISDKVKKIEYNAEKNITTIYSKNLIGLDDYAYVKIKETSHSDDYYSNGDKFMVESVDKTNGCFCIKGNVSPDMKKQVSWCLSKDDLSPQDIFKYTNEGNDKKAIVAKYCIQDCNLVHELVKKIDVITGIVEMANICSVPLSFIVMRGQGIKLTSFISKKCREKQTLMPTLDKGRDSDGYEGAIVLEPKTNLYLDDPVACVDYSSLYPSSMISENLCHSSKVWTQTYDLNGNLVAFTGERNADGDFIYDNLPNMKYVDVEFDTYKYIRKNPKAAATKVKCGKKICRFAQYKDKKAILPSVLEELLAQRKATKKLKDKEKDPFMKNIYDKRQLSIKLTANSIYGQAGASVGDFYEPDVAASTTAVGRKLLTYAKRIIEEVYGDKVCETKEHGNVRTRAEYIYGDTDSVFFCFNLEDMNGNKIKGQKALAITIELAKQAGHLASQFLKYPHDLEYEKTFLPFCLLSKKRYVGMLYEDDPTPGACYRKSMGIVLKRRDNAPIVKDVYGGIIDILMKEKSIEKSLEFLNTMLQQLIEGKVPMEKLIITKSLRGHYANPKQIAHKVLADRITLRDPGNKPSVGDRIPFVYIENNDKKALQGDKIELPSYIVEHKLKVDYVHYITNQIMKPVLQVYGLVLENILEMKNKKRTIQKIHNEIESYRAELDHDKFIEKREKIRCNYIKKYLFDDAITKVKNKKAGNQSIMALFNTIKK